MPGPPGGGEGRNEEQEKDSTCTRKKERNEWIKGFKIKKERIDKYMLVMLLRIQIQSRWKTEVDTQENGKERKIYKIKWILVIELGEDGWFLDEV